MVSQNDAFRQNAHYAYAPYRNDRSAYAHSSHNDHSSVFPGVSRPFQSDHSAVSPSMDCTNTLHPHQNPVASSTLIGGFLGSSSLIGGFLGFVTLIGVFLGRWTVIGSPRDRLL